MDIPGAALVDVEGASQKKPDADIVLGRGRQVDFVRGGGRVPVLVQRAKQGADRVVLTDVVLVVFLRLRHVDGEVEEVIDRAVQLVGPPVIGEGVGRSCRLTGRRAARRS